MIRAGDTITLTFNLTGSNMEGAQGTLTYDAAQLELVGSPKQIIAAPWVVEFNGNNMVAYDNDLSAPLNGTKGLFTLTFKVKALAVGTQVTVSYTGVKVGYLDGSEDQVGTVSYTATIAQPLSTNNKLSGLTVSNATLSPAFEPNTTGYTASVPFEVSKLEVSATAADGKAKVSISSPDLGPNGVTNVTVTVTAENGSKKVYTIAVTRAQDPNYQPSGNNDLAGIQVDGFLLSPSFSPDRTEYVVWLPYETESIQISGTAADKLGNVTVEGGEALEAGKDNVVKVICVAEDGTEKVYTVIAKRAAAHGSDPVDPNPTDPSPTEPDATEPDTTEPEATEPKPTQPTAGGSTGTPAESAGLPWWTLLIALAVGLAIGLPTGMAMKKRK